MASFFFDTDADMRIGRRLRSRGHLLMSAREQRLATARDIEILLFAGRQGLILITHNERDFEELHRVGAIHQHAGILVLPQVPPADVAMATSHVDWLVSSGRPLANELYRLDMGIGWERWDDLHQWLPL